MGGVGDKSEIDHLSWLIPRYNGLKIGDFFFVKREGSPLYLLIPNRAISGLLEDLGLLEETGTLALLARLVLFRALSKKKWLIKINFEKV